MPERALQPLIDAVPIRIRAFYRSAGGLLRELSRALNQEHTTLRAESGLPVGTRLALVLATDSLARPIEIWGTVTGCRRRGARHEIGLRYDFDVAPHRARLSEAMSELKRETRKPRREARLPTVLRVEAGALARGLRATVSNLSRAGCRIELEGPRLPRLDVGDRLVLALAGSRQKTRTPVRLLLDLRWIGRSRRRRARRAVEVGASFASLEPAQRARIGDILRFDDFRPGIRIRRLLRAPAPAPRRRRP
jgi:hypothetical protein